LSECSWDCPSDFASETVFGGDDRGGGDNDGGGGNAGDGGNGGDGGNDGGGNGGGGNDGGGGNGGDGEPDGDDAKTWTHPAHLAGSRRSIPSSDLLHLHSAPLQAWRPGAAPAPSSYLVHLRWFQSPHAAPDSGCSRMAHTYRTFSYMSISLTMPGFCHCNTTAGSCRWPCRSRHNHGRHSSRI
jgi:hypothetical protein